MQSIHFFNNNRARRVATRFLQVAAFSMLAGLAIHAKAADSREVHSRVAPVYPEVARRMKIGGVVKVEAIVDPGGKVKDAKALNGNHILSPAAEEAVRRWTFEPADTQSTVDVEVNFSAGE
jgi:TonB family protein